jgi:magnesium transporter
MNKSLLKSFGVSSLIPRFGKPASVPGTVEYIGKTREAPVRLHIMNYNETDFTEKDLASIEESLPFELSPAVTWLNIIGVHNENLIHRMGEIFNIHPLALEDIANTTQRPKVEEYEDYLYIILKMTYFNRESDETVIEQVSMLVGKDYVITLQEREGDILDSLRERIRNNKGKIRKQGSDFLMYGIIDTIVDYYFTVLERTGERMEELEEQLLLSATQELLNKIYSIKQELVFIRKAIWPLREVVSTLQRDEFELIGEDSQIYLRDVYDHAIQVVETVESFRETASSMLDLYLSTVSNKMNEVMKVLTIFAAIFIPLTFLAGVYGMNFKMPELGWKFSYPVWWIITICLAVGMLIYFRRKKWL